MAKEFSLFLFLTFTSFFFFFFISRFEIYLSRHEVFSLFLVSFVSSFSLLMVCRVFLFVVTLGFAWEKLD